MVVPKPCGSASFAGDGDVLALAALGYAVFIADVEGEAKPFSRGIAGASSEAAHRPIERIAGDDIASAFLGKIEVSAGR